MMISASTKNIHYWASGSDLRPRLVSRGAAQEAQAGANCPLDNNATSTHPAATGKDPLVPYLSYWTAL